VFDDIRTPELEKESPKIVALEVDEEGIYDYEQMKSKVYRRRDLRQMLWNDIVAVKATQQLY